MNRNAAVTGKVLPSRPHTLTSLPCLGYQSALDIVIVRCYIRPMKRKDHSGEPALEGGSPLAGLLDAMLAMRNVGELRALLEDLCTPAELEAMADRWRVVPLLLEGKAYREIHDQTGVSVTTTGRVARCLDLGAGGYRIAAARLLLPVGDSMERAK